MSQPQRKEWQPTEQDRKLMAKMREEERKYLEQELVGGTVIAAVTANIEGKYGSSAQVGIRIKRTDGTVVAVFVDDEEHDLTLYKDKG